MITFVKAIVFNLPYGLKLLLMNSPLNDCAGVISTRKPGCVFKQKDITDTIINNTEAQATICIISIVVFGTFFKDVAAIKIQIKTIRKENQIHKSNI